jgi:hypothetical protein
MSTPKRPLEEEGVEPLQNRLDHLPGASPAAARRKMLLMGVGAIGLIVLLILLLRASS